MKLLTLGNNKNYSSLRFIEEAPKLGISLNALTFSDIDIRVENNQLVGRVITGDDILNFDAYIFRAIPKGFLNVAYIVAGLVHEKDKVVFDKKFVLGTNCDYKFPYPYFNNGLPVIDTRIISSRNQIEETDFEFPIVVKSLTGARGEFVFKVNSKDELYKKFEELNKMVIQKYLPIQFDYRILVLGNRVVGCMKRYLSDDKFRTNISLGGKGEMSELSNNIYEDCIKAAQLCHLDLAGVDVILHEGKHYILEVNHSPQFGGFENSTGINVAKEILTFIKNKVSNS